MSQLPEKCEMRIRNFATIRLFGVVVTSVWTNIASKLIVASRMRRRLKLLLWNFSTSYGSNAVCSGPQSMGSVTHRTNKTPTQWSKTTLPLRNSKSDKLSILAGHWNVRLLYSAFHLWLRRRKCTVPSVSTNTRADRTISVRPREWE